MSDLIQRALSTFENQINSRHIEKATFISKRIFNKKKKIRKMEL